MAQGQDYQSHHGYIDQEFLKLQEELGRERKQKVHRRMNIQAGNRVLDVGCGPGTDTIPLAHLTGSTGQVIGIDHDQEMLNKANQRAIDAGVAGWTEHRLGDASALPFDNDYFDACHSERLFLHLRGAKQAFSEIARVTKPGGRIAIIDVDAGTSSINTSEVNIERRLNQFWAEIHNNGYSGRQLYHFFKMHGFNDVEVDSYVYHFTTLAVARHLGRWDEVEGKAMEAGVVTKTELERYRETLEEAEKVGGFYSSVNLVMVFGSKPPNSP